MRNRQFPNYPDDTDYTTNSPSYYEDLARKQKLIEMLSKKIWEYENTLNETLEEIEKRLTDYILENDILMNERLENWDQRMDEMPEEMRSLFVTWLNDGTLEQIINHDVLGNKADQAELDKTNEKLTKTNNNHLNSIRPQGITRKTIVSFISDDGPDNDFVKLEDISRTYNVPFGMALVPSRDNQITDEHIQEALDLGWDFASHSLDHSRLTELNEEELHWQFSESKRLIEARGLSADYLVYPFNDSSPLVRKVARQYFKFALRGLDRPVQYPADTYAIERVTMGAFTQEGEDTLEFYKQKFDEALENNQWIIYMLHANAPAFNATQQQHLKDLILYIKSKEVEIKTVTDAYKEMGNAFTTPNSGYLDGFTITNRGEIFGAYGSRNKVQMGLYAQSDGAFSTALGIYADSPGTNSIALGHRANSNGAYSTALGDRAVSENQSVAIGTQAKANGHFSTTTGALSESSERLASSYGYASKATGDNSTAIGSNARSSTASSTAIGHNANASGMSSTTVGRNSTATNTESNAFGHNAKATSAGAIAIGAGTESSEGTAIALGHQAKATGTNAIAIGRGAVATGYDFILGTINNKVRIPSDGMYLKSPNGTSYLVRVNDAGEVYTQQEGTN